MSGRFWSILLLMIVTILALLVVSFVFGLLLGGIGVAVSEDSEAVGAAVTFVAAVIATAITTPIFAAIISVLYFDQRVRKEGFDLQLLAEGVGEQGSYPTAPQAPPRPRCRTPSRAGRPEHRLRARAAGFEGRAPGADRRSTGTTRTPSIWPTGTCRRSRRRSSGGARLPGAPARLRASARNRLARSLADRMGPRVPGTNTWIGQPERFLEELERAKSSRT